MSKKRKSPEAPEPINFPGAFELFRPSWQALKLNLITFLELILLPILVSLLSFVGGHNGNWTFSILSYVVTILTGPALILTQLKSVAGKQIDFLPAIRESLPYVWRYLLLLLCIGFVTLVGLVLLIIPGLFMIKRYLLSPYYLMDRDVKVFEAMRLSAADSKRFGMAIWGILGVYLLLAVLSLVLIGYILFYVYLCAPAIRYRQIKEVAA
jgi:hypothetical protein